MPIDCAPSTYRVVLLSLLVILPSCERTADSDEAPEEVPADEEVCPTPAAGAEVLIRPGAITLLGEIHGTAEIPSFVGAIACEATQGHPVLIGLEIPEEMNQAFAVYLASEGSDLDRGALLAHRFWTLEDGRASQAMLGLLETLRRLSRDGKAVEVFGFDGSFSNGEARDVGMAANIVERLMSSGTEDAVVLILTGNLHARTADERWMGWHVSREFPWLTSLNTAYSGGTAWVCTSEGCGPRSLTGRNRGDSVFVERSSEPDGNGYHGTFYVGPVSASPPAMGDQAAGGV
jgi:hypothetical protein